MSISHLGFAQSFWNPQTSNTTATLRSVYFINNDTGYTVGNSGTILKTTDGGYNWISQTSNTTYDLLSVYFINADTGFTVGNHQTIYPNIRWRFNLVIIE